MTNPIDAPPIELFVPSIVVEGGGEIHATFIKINAVNVTVDAGGHINSDGEGYNHTHSESAHGGSNIFSDYGSVNPGYPVSYRRSGASHGGSGGRVWFNGQSLRTEKAYGHIFEPRVFGSTGGIGYHSTSYGGNGGGIIHMNVTGLLHVDGQITVDGAAATELSAGGGSGGSIWVFVHELAGYGRFAAEGGAGSHDGGNPGGGGGGGRIAIYYTVNSTMSDFR